MILTPGLTFGAYKILAPLGRGGMGEVYRARDTRLGRDVALKILREDGTADPERVRRFEDEARAASSLNHPNIVVIYEVGDAVIPGETAPTRYLAMELLEGQSLNEIVAGKRLATRRFLDIAFQLADGLARAHEGGIIHRDLKPSNIVVSADDHVKILDFGLAKLRSAPEDGSSAPTERETQTAPGTVMGTVGYMSPEQVRGEPAGAASDQFSLGCILYEMLTGGRPFRGKSSADVLSAILRDDPPPITESNPLAPDPVCWIVERCLAKSAGHRYVSTRDLARDLQNLRGHVLESKPRMSGGDLPERPRRRWWRGAAVAGALLLLGAGAALLVIQPWKPRSEPNFRRLTFRRGIVWRALFVPNSDNILYSASWDGLATKTFLTIPQSSGNDRSLDSENQLPMAFSQDGSEVLVLLDRSRAAINIQGTLAWWPALGGQPRPIMKNAGWADWSGSAGLLAVVRDTGAERILELRKADGQLERSVFRTVGGISYVRFSPDGRSIAFIHHPSRYDNAGEVRIAETRRAVSRSLTPTFERCAGLDWNPRTGDIWFTASRANLYTTTVWRVSAAGRLRSLQSLPDVYTLQDVSGSGDRCLLSSSSSGRGLVVRRRGVSPKDFTWLGLSMIADISLDGKSLLFLDGGATEKSYGTWMRSLSGGDAIRLGAYSPGTFSPDGHSVVAMTPQLAGPPQLVSIPVGPGTPHPLTSDSASHTGPSFAGPDTILFERALAGTSEIWRMSKDGTQARSLGATGCDLPSASPAGRSFVCRCGEAKGTLYLFPMEKGEGRRLAELPNEESVIYARWSRSGSEVFAVTSDLQFLTIDASSGKILATESVDLGETVAPNTLRAAAFNDDASVQGYSFERFSSGLYLADGL